MRKNPVDRKGQEVLSTLRMCTYLSIFLFSVVASAQKYNFVNWTVEDGLVQSQASYICQDHNRQLWIGTEGGVSRFDGKKFTAYTVQDGLIANHINVLLCDKTGNLWIGTNEGICVYDGRKFHKIKTIKVSAYNITELAQVNNGAIYAIDNFSLLKVEGLEGKRVLVSGDSTERTTSLFPTVDGTLLVAVYKKGIYSVRNDSQQLISALGEADKKILIRSIYISSANDTLLCTNAGLYKLKNNVILPFTDVATVGLNVLCIEEDIKQNLWLGTDNGCYKLEGKSLIHFGEKSGFTDNAVNHIYRDIENNLWFATNADGIFKFRENTFTYYDKSSGLSNAIVMGVTQTPDKTVYAAGYGGGLYKVNAHNDLVHVNYKGETLLKDSKINCLYADHDNNVWIGTLNQGSFIYNEKTGLQAVEAKNNPDLNIRNATVFFKDQKGNMLIGTNQGLLVLDREGSINKVKKTNLLVTALKQFDKQHVVVGTSRGVYLLDDNYELSPLNEKAFGNASVLCLSKNGNNIWVGTTDKGVYNWDLKTDKIITYTTVDGLPSNFIYSIDVSENNKAWIGTGFGISNLLLNGFGKIVAIKNYGRSDGLLGMECNHNCLLKAADSSLWFGTTKGLFHFNPPTNISEKNQPFVFLRSVKLFSSYIEDSTLFKDPGYWFHVPEELKLHSKQNHLTFEFGAIYFTNPEDLLYRYKLEGIDKEFTTTSNPSITYPALPPGKYTLKVSALTKSGAISSNTVSYSFEIEKAFYQTRFFQIVIILLLLGTGALLAYISTRGRQKRKQKAKELLEKIREEEFIKLRQRTAEDFHDEMGNSLTRISVLTDILKSKINGKEPEVSSLVTQIKQNTTALYNGSKDIIWSLNSQNDGLYVIVEHLKDIGRELFLETPVDFQFTHNISSQNKLKLKLDYSRNLTMIFKEAYSNILKHAKADTVSISIYLNSMDQLEITIRDNGSGFKEESILNGNGLKNMKTRAGRMNGTMTTGSAVDEGTEINFLLKNIFI